MVCGGFNCSKNALIVLNVLYILVSFILIGVAAYGRVAAMVTSLTLVGSLIACGVFLFIISLIGLIGAAKHHQVLLFFYMIILFLLFLLQFSLACACLAVNQDQKDALAEQGWRMASNDTRHDVQRQFDCCGFKDPDLDFLEPLGHPVCVTVAACCDKNSDAFCCSGIINGSQPPCPCQPCLLKMREVIYNAFSVTGGVGLFFSLTEIIGVWLAMRYRNQKDPLANPSAFL
ncbi:tetraspanin-13-like isoform X2 [Pomacea canaliculata]|uniref:tetraspanin-13-like isoform X2 n=1 Tax=Pomacea canaliculata TaxID=400727 RepID=UPI000D73E002|nr:tetraspanin-13-like isoform X2 [Pomacea canaliculata]